MKNRERWMELCARAAEEQDPTQMLVLVREINKLLEEKEQRLNTLRRGGHLTSDQSSKKSHPEG